MISDRIVFDPEIVGPWVEKNGGGYYRDGTKAIGLRSSDGLVAGVMYDYWNGASVYMHVAIRGRITREFLWVCFDYPFNQLGCNVVLGLVAEDNKAAQRFDEHLGFRLQTRIENAHPSGALLLYVMRKEDCRWANLPHRPPLTM